MGNQTAVVFDMNAETLVTDEDGRNCNKGLAKKCKDNARANARMESKKGGEEVVCYNCLLGGKLLCCCGKGCQRRFHPSCVDPPLNYIPPGFWHCIWCVKTKIELGVHSVSPGVESILDSREVVSNNEVMQREYFVKYQGLAHAHNCWASEKQMLLKAPKLLEKFKRKPQVIRWKRDWSIPHRLLLKREIVLSKKNDRLFDRHDGNDPIRCYEWLVKWTGLGYDNVTWELSDASFLTSPEGMKLIDEYESRHKRADRLSKNNFDANEEKQTSFTELSMLPFGDSPGFYNQHLGFVNKLCMCWHGGQSALIVDDQIDKERVMKVILFILSLNCNVKRPFLIISTSTALSVWETEFLNLAPFANVVVYKGNKDTRNSIRELEFFNEDDGILFQILLSSSDVIIEDLHALRCIRWEVIIIDECQRSKILGHLDNIKFLKAEMRLLLASGQIKEDQSDYIRLLSFLKSGHHGSNIAQMETYFSASISNLKSQLEQYVVFKCYSGSTRFVEYWVPAHLSSLQIEQYCSMLLSNLMLLCSGQKSDSVDALHDLIISTRKCCDHPYLLDHSLDNFVTNGQPVEEHLNIGIKASGKLQLLEKILLEARSCGLRVLILFQSTGGPRSIGDILDDVLCRKFGKDCYVRYGRGYIPSKKQAAMDTFNNRENGKFVFLMESRACLPSVRLSSVDIVILFDSDWDPKNDLRGLQKMSISSQQFKQLTVFRLYSFFTVEEKVLMLAKEGTALDGNMQLINQSTCHTLLKWGILYLFNKLDDLHTSVTSDSMPDISCDQSLLGDVMCELSSQLISDSGDTDCHEWSFISRVQQNGGEYARNILSLGETVMKNLGNEPHNFSWSDLLEGRHPQWKFLPASSQRTRKTVKYFDHIFKESECENDVIIGKKRTLSQDNADSKRSKVSKDNVDPNNGRKVTKDKIMLKMRRMSKDIIDTKGWKVSNHVDPKNRKAFKDIVDSKGREVSKNIVDSQFKKKRLKQKKKNKKNLSVASRASISNGNTNGLSNVLDSMVHPLTTEITRATATNMLSSEKKKLLDIPNGMELSKSDISALCDALHFSVGSQYILNKKNSDREEKQTRRGEFSGGEQGPKSRITGTNQGHPRFGELFSGVGKNVKAVAMRILEHIFTHYNVNCEEVSTMQAFEISVCWLAASVLKHKIDRKDSLALAKLYLNFGCNEEEVTLVYAELWKYMKDFSSGLQNGLCVEKCNINDALDSKVPVLKDLVEEVTQKEFQGPCVLKLVEPATSEHDFQKKPPSTVASQDQTCTLEICLSPMKVGCLPVETDAISKQSDMEDDRMNAMASMIAEISSLECQTVDVDPVTGSLERQIPLRSTEITQSDGIAFEDPQILENELVAIDNAMNLSIHLVQVDCVTPDAVACTSTAVPEVKNWCSVTSPLHGESTTPEFTETTGPYMQSLHSNLCPVPQLQQRKQLSWLTSFCSVGIAAYLKAILYFSLGRFFRLISSWYALKLFSSYGFTTAACIFQMAMSAIPSFLEHDSASPVMPLDNIFHISSEDHCYSQEAEVIWEAPNNLVEPVDPPFVSPVILQPSSSVPVPIEENTTHVAHGLTNPGCMNSDSFQAHSVASEMSHVDHPDPLLVEMERIEQDNEQAFQIYKQKILQLQSDYEMEFEELSKKYKMLLQNVHTEAEFKIKELETQYRLVAMNKVLAEVWICKA
ncbi:hypothetical protein RJT34_19796 [Clitoria ternatea]|uniref:Uncharacterized protein n=1 Tax=Clitoria ternatea TaxID=43366 RepID=A0AAN9IS49_CLITE